MERKPLVGAHSRIHFPGFHSSEITGFSSTIGGVCTRCTTPRALRTFAWAFNQMDVHDSLRVVTVKPDKYPDHVGELLRGCDIDAPALTWTVYYCALSLHGPRELHPMAPRLAARFIRGGDMEKFVIAKTVLAWRGLPPPPAPDSPLFGAVRGLAVIATALDWYREISPADSRQAGGPR